jgi:hypothetical protein
VESSYVPTIAGVLAPGFKLLGAGTDAAPDFWVANNIGYDAAHRVREAAIANVAGVQAIPKVTPPGKAKLARGETNVLVLNGSGAAGAAGTAADGLRVHGYRITSVGNARKQSTSTRTLVMYRRGYRAEAARLARDVHARIVTPLDGMRRSALMGAQIVLVVGN